MALNVQRVAMPLVRQLVNRPRLAELLMGRDKWGNPLGDDRYSDPFPMLKRMRADGEVVYRRSYQSWFIFGYDEIQALVGHKDVSAERFIVDVMEVRPYNKLTPKTQTFFRSWMLIRDDPDHARIRRLVSRAFTPKRVAELEPTVLAGAQRLLQTLAKHDSVDIAAEFNARFPVHVIAQMLGIPAEREQWLMDIGADIGLFLSPFDRWDHTRIDRAVDHFDAYIGELADQRRRDPQPDLLTALVKAEDEGRKLSHDELVANVGLLAFAGFDTTASALGNFMLALFRNPDQRRLVMDDPGLWPNAIDELLRYDGPSALNQRYTLADVEVGGQTIPSGSGVSLLLQAGNRDPRRWSDADQLILNRHEPNPLSFGHGAHYCLGAHLARLELRIGMQCFLEHFGRYEVDESSIEWRRSLAIRGPLSMTVRRGR